MLIDASLVKYRRRNFVYDSNSRTSGRQDAMVPILARRFPRYYAGSDDSRFAMMKLHLICPACADERMRPDLEFPVPGAAAPAPARPRL